MPGGSRKRASLLAAVPLSRLHRAGADEERRFVETHPRSHELSTRAGDSLLAGVPMPWMTRWAGSLPLFVDSTVTALMG